MSHVIFGVEKLIFGQKSRKRYWTLVFYRKIIGFSDHIRYVQNNMGLQNKGTCNERLFCYTEVQRAEYHYPFYLNISQCLCIFHFKFVI